jgi:hypothetical protein
MSMRSVRLVSLFAFCGLLIAPTASRVAAAETGPKFIPGEILVGYGSSRLETRSAATAIGDVGVVAGVDAKLNIARVRLRPGISVESAIARLGGRQGVSFAEPNYLVHACATPNDPAYVSLQYAPKKIQANLSWDIWKPRSTVVVAMVDTGVEATHSDLQAIMFRNGSGQVVGWNTLNNTAAFGDDAGHGTHGTGVALAHINDATGLAGTAGWNPTVSQSDGYLKAMPIKALDAAGVGTAASIAAAITWAADNGAKVINVSAATDTASSTMENAVNYAWGKGCLIVAAAGNEAGTGFMYPAAYTNVLSVGSTDNTDTMFFTSQYGAWVKCAAPGANVYSTYKLNSYTGRSGTSAAAPHVAAEAAAIWAQNPTLTNAQVSSLIVSNVDPVLPYQGRNFAAGVGRINVYRALLAAGDGTPSLTSVSFNPTTIPNQTTSTGTVQIGGPAPAGGMAVTLESLNTAIATVPASVTIPEGATSITFAATGKLVDNDSSVTIKATANSKSVSGVLVVRGSVVKSVAVSPSSVPSMNSFTGTIALDAPAKAGGAVVTLSDNGAGTISIPSTVTVPAGTKTVSFNGSAGAVTRKTSVTITASLNDVSTTFTMYVTAIGLSSITVDPTSVLGGVSATGKVTLASAAPAGGLVVTLTSSNTAAAKAPASVTVSAGATTASFTVSTFVVSATKSVTLSAIANGLTKTCTLSVTAMLKSHAISPSSAYGGLNSTGTVTLAAPAPAGGAVVNLSSNSGVAGVPATVTVLEGATTATYPITTTPVSVNTVASITASYNGANLIAKLTVKPPIISKVVLLPTIVIGGGSSVGTVTLTGAAPAGGTIVTLTSNNAGATAPGSVTVPAGAKTATFSVTTTAVTANILATISGITGTTTKTATLTITP